MTDQPEDYNIQSIEVKDQFGTKYQRYFKTMVIEQETKEGGVFHNKIPKIKQNKDEGTNDSIIDPSYAVVTATHTEQD